MEVWKFSVDGSCERHRFLRSSFHLSASNGSALLRVDKNLKRTSELLCSADFPGGAGPTFVFVPGKWTSEVENNQSLRQVNYLSLPSLPALEFRSSKFQRDSFVHA